MRVDLCLNCGGPVEKPKGLPHGDCPTCGPYWGGLKSGDCGEAVSVAIVERCSICKVNEVGYWLSDHYEYPEVVVCSACVAGLRSSGKVRR